MDREEFREYIDCFNDDDFEGFGRYYAPDVEFNLGDRKRIVGRENVLDFYRDVATQVRETLDVQGVIVDGDRIAAELDTEFYAVEDAPEFVAGPLAAGESLHIHSFVHYWLEDDRFTTIKSARYGSE